MVFSITEVFRRYSLYGRGLWLLGVARERKWNRLAGSGPVGSRLSLAVSVGDGGSRDVLVEDEGSRKR